MRLRYWQNVRGSWLEDLRGMRGSSDARANTSPNWCAYACSNEGAHGSAYVEPDRGAKLCAVHVSERCTEHCPDHCADVLGVLEYGR